MRPLAQSMDSSTGCCGLWARRRKRWANEHKGGWLASTPSIDGVSIYVLSADFVLVSYSLKNGQKQWSHYLLGDFAGQQIKWKNAASPVVDGNLVIVGGGGAGQSLLAFNKVTGKLAWKTGTEIMTHATPVVAEIHGVRQVIFFCVSGLVSLRSIPASFFGNNRSNLRSPLQPAGGGWKRGVLLSRLRCGWRSLQSFNERGAMEHGRNLAYSGHKHVGIMEHPVLKDGHLYGV